MDSILNSIAEVSIAVFVLCVLMFIALKVSIDRDNQRAIQSSFEDEAKRLLPSWQSGVIRGYQPIETGERSEPPQGGSASIPIRSYGDDSTTLKAMKALADAMRCSKMTLLPESSPSTGYTPLLDDDPYQSSEEYCETWNEALLRNTGKFPAPQVDLLLIGKEYR